MRTLSRANHGRPRNGALRPPRQIGPIRPIHRIPTGWPALSEFARARDNPQLATDNASDNGQLINHSLRLDPQPLPQMDKLVVQPSAPQLRMEDGGRVDELSGLLDPAGVEIG
jgi:hypothetical protein